MPQPLEALSRASKAGFAMKLKRFALTISGRATVFGRLRQIITAIKAWGVEVSVRTLRLAMRVLFQARRPLQSKRKVNNNYDQ